MNGKLVELTEQPFTTRSAAHKRALTQLGLDPDSPMPPDHKLQDSYRKLQPFFSKVDDYYKEFLRLKSIGKC